MTAVTKPGEIKILSNQTDSNNFQTGPNQKVGTVAPYIEIANGSLFPQGAKRQGGRDTSPDSRMDILSEEKEDIRSIQTRNPGIMIASKRKNQQMNNDYRIVRDSNEKSSNAVGNSFRSKFNNDNNNIMIMNGRVNVESPKRGGDKLSSVTKAPSDIEIKPERKAALSSNNNKKPLSSLDDQKQSLNAAPLTVAEKLAPLRSYRNPVKLIDANFKWTDVDLKLPSEQTSHLVVGVLGKQGVGKTTLINALCNGSSISKNRSNKRDLRATANNTAGSVPMKIRVARESMRYETSGIEMQVTEDRMIFLDSQPVLSSSVLHWLNKTDRQPPPEVKYYENWVHLQSLQMACYLLSVCHVLIVVSDWGVDFELVEFLQLAEMLKPSPPVPTDRNGHTIPPIQHTANIIFVVNKVATTGCGSFNWAIQHRLTCLMINEALKASKFKLHDGVNDEALRYETNYGHWPASLSSCVAASKKEKKGVVAEEGCGNDSKRDVDSAEEPTDNNNRIDDMMMLNLCYIPSFSSLTHNNKHSDVTGGCKPHFEGRVGFEETVEWLGNRLAAIRLNAPSHITVHNTEKHWLMHGQKMWDITKKSQLITEYCQFLT